MSKHVYIDGKWESGLGDPMNVTCPARGEVVWEGLTANGEQVGRAVDGARLAFEKWRITPFAERAEVLKRYAVQLDSVRKPLAESISKEMGKQLWEAETEVGAMIGKIAISISSYQERTGTRSETTNFGTSTLTHKPHGVLAVLGPFNFPGHLPNGHIVPALLAGNTCVFKPSEYAPSVAALMVEAASIAGIPDGCFQVLNGQKQTGEALLNSQINGVLFTGSPKTGCNIHIHFAGRPEVMLALEMGGNNPLIVWEPADIDFAADVVIQSAHMTTGQRCSCVRRVILPDNSFGRRVIEAVEAKAGTIAAGAWDEGKASMGPLVSEQTAISAVDFQKLRCQKGATIIKPIERMERGFGFVSVGIIDSTEAENLDEELFAPLIQIHRVDNFDQAIHLANNTRYGLSGGLVCDDDRLWKRVKDDLRCGILNRNRSIVGAASNLPFGGPGLSGNYRPGAYYAADYCSWPQASQVSERTLSADG